MSVPKIHADDAPQFNLPDVRFIGLAAPSRGSRENAAWRFAVRAGASGHPHRVTREEIFIALSGRARAMVDGVAHELAAGDALVVPAQSELSLSNPGEEEFLGVAVLPIGGQVVIGDGVPFTPPWAL